MSREAILALMADSALGTFGQTCLVGVLLNLAAALAIAYLWAEDHDERHLAFWWSAHLLSALRWAATYAAVLQASVPFQVLAGLLAAVSITLNLAGALVLLQPDRPATRPLNIAIAAFFLLLTALGAWLGLLSLFYAVATPLAWAAAAWIFWRAHRRQPLGAYRLATAAMLCNSLIWTVGFMLAGRTIVASIILPLTALPAMVAFFAIAHQRALAKARDSEETVGALLDTVPIPVVIALPPDGRVERINRAALDAFGQPAAAYVGKSGPESGVIQDMEIRRQIYVELAGGRDVRNREMIYLRNNHQAMQVSVNASAVELRTGTRYVFTLYDLTEFRRVEAALQSLNATLEQQVLDRTRDLEVFNYSVSHDLRAPLRAIEGYSNLLAEELGDALSGPARDYVDRIRANCQRMGELIDAMISLAQHAAAALEPTVVDLSALAKRLLDEMKHADPGRRVEVRIEPWLRSVADREAATIVMDNLLRNAWKYSSRMPVAQIEVGATMHEGERVFFVRDNGAGFDMRHAGNLFKPFQRLHRADQFEGTGIGLATVSRLIHNHGGRIWAESALGRGATFYFHFGRQPDAAEGAGKAAPAGPLT